MATRHQYGFTENIFVVPSMDTKVTDLGDTLCNGQCFQPVFKLGRIKLEKIGCRNIE